MLCGWAVPVLAAPVEVVITDRAVLGQGAPSVSVHIQERIAGFELKLRRSDGRDLVFADAGAPGTVRVFSLPQPVGAFRYTGELTVRFPNSETSTMPLQFDAEMIRPLELTVENKDLDLLHRKLHFKLTRPAQKAQLTVVMDTGKVALDDELPFRGEPAGTRLEVTWPEAPGRVIKIALRAYDTSDAYSSVELFPWQLEVPHQEVAFDAGKWEIPRDQHQKLDLSYRELSRAVAQFLPLAPVRLFIVAHPMSKQDGELSLHRARAIGRFFQKRRLRIPILYGALPESAAPAPAAGPGGDAGAPSVRYILSVGDPDFASGTVKPSWQTL
jgi:hypothetical protein